MVIYAQSTIVCGYIRAKKKKKKKKKKRKKEKKKKKKKEEETVDVWKSQKLDDVVLWLAVSVIARRLFQVHVCDRQER